MRRHPSTISKKYRLSVRFGRTTGGFPRQMGKLSLRRDGGAVPLPGRALPTSVRFSRRIGSQNKVITAADPRVIIRYPAAGYRHSVDGDPVGLRAEEASDVKL